MRFLYGDSTESTLELNYIELLQDALDFSADVVVASHRMRELRAGRRERESGAAQEIQRIEALATRVASALEGTGGAESSTGRCAADIERLARSAVDAEVGRVKSGLADDLGRLDAEIERERQACVRSLETLLLSHDLPKSKLRVRIGLADGTRYQARLQLESGMGLDAVLELDIASGTLFGEPVRVEKIVPNLEIKAPESKGLLHKKLTLVPKRLNKKVIVELMVGDDELQLKLRANPTLDDEGYDVTVSGGDMRVTRVQKSEDDALPPFELEGSGATGMETLCDTLRAGALELATARKALVTAALDASPVASLENPDLIVERLIETLTPVIREIRRHTPVAGELVLKRELSTGHREEIFVPLEDLRARLQRLTPEQRKVFAPLQLLEQEDFSDEAVTAVAGGAEADVMRLPTSELDDAWLEGAEPSDVPAVDVALSSLEGELGAAED
jgi:hypothetical protein